MPYRITLFNNMPIGNTFRFRRKWFVKNRSGLAYQVGAQKNILNGGLRGISDSHGVALMMDTDLVGVMCDPSGLISRS